MTPVSELELAEAPSITLGGRPFKVPEIVARQNRIITPRILGLLDLMVRISISMEQAKSGGDPAASLLGFRISSDEYDDLIDIAHAAIWRVAPDVKREELDDWPIKTFELFAMLLVVAQQAGLKPKKEEVADPLLAAATSPQPTGTPSPQRSPSPQDGSSITS